MNNTLPSKIEAAEKGFAGTERAIATLRAFFSKHSDALEQIDWRAYGWNDTEIKIDGDQFFGERLKPNAIAKLFGSDGWVRQHNNYACGSVDWVKCLDGCNLKIENAESIKPKLVETVKFHTD